MKRETNSEVAYANGDTNTYYAIANTAKAAGMDALAWHEARQGELSEKEAEIYDYFLYKFDVDERKKRMPVEVHTATGGQFLERKHGALWDHFTGAFVEWDDSEYGKLQSELATLRQQVATLTAERDAAREALMPFAAYATYHSASSHVYIPEWDSAIPLEAFVNAAAVLATPPRLDSEGARLPFALADDGAATPDVFMDVAKEMDRQVRKWGVQRHDPTMWITILLEEVGEVAKAALETWHQGKDDDPKGEQYRTELVHVMAVAASAVRSLEMNNAEVTHE